MLVMINPANLQLKFSRFVTKHFISSPEFENVKTSLYGYNTGLKQSEQNNK